jgi:oligopeptide/dipeptide ABC transporter ATP-binding protein
MKVGEIVGEPLIVHSQLNRRERDARVHRLLADVGLQPWQADLYPHEFSGGQRQRICIARALALEPKLIILDEPVSALDVSVQAQIINLLKSVQARTGVAYLLISHSLATVRYLCNRVAVMYLGQIVELGDGRAIFSNPRHPYTRALIEAARPIRKSDEPRDALHGEVPSPLNPPAGCRFHTRCSFAMDRCRSEGPSLDAISQSRSVRCHVFNSPVQGDLPDAVKEVMR